MAAGLQYLNAMTTQPLFAAGQQRFLVWMSTFNLLLNIAVNIVLVPRIGAAGAGVAMITSELIGAIAAAARLWWIGAPAVRPAFLLRLVPPLAAGAGVFWLFDGNWFVLAALLAGTAYVLALFVTRAVSPAQVKQLARREKEDTEAAV